MRDIALLLFLVISIPFMVKRPSYGIIVWVWLSVMNPHRLTYGFAYEFPFAAVTAIFTFIGLLVSKEERKLPLTPPVIALALFTLFMCLTSLFPFHPGTGYDMWSRVMKINLMTFVAFAVIRTKQQIRWLIWVVVGSLGFYGLKGGVFTLVTGGGDLVWGPPGTFIEGNNELALALVMTIPMLRYLQIEMTKTWQKHATTGAILLVAFAAIGSHSRGALLAIGAMAIVLWWKSRNKAVMGIASVLAAVAILAFMPSNWFERMQTIETYDTDASALGRINAWWMAFNMACDRPLGGGFDIYDLDVFARYAPNPIDVHAAHSIYFQVMAEHGFLGLILFLSIGVLTWMAATDGKRRARNVPGLDWVGPIMDMMKSSMIGYAVGGAFLSLAYLDIPLYVMVVIVSTRELVVRVTKARTATEQPPAAGRSGRFGNVAVVDDLVDDVPTQAPDPGKRWRGDRPPRPRTAFDLAEPSR